jgi:hypothetical protein
MTPIQTARFWSSITVTDPYECWNWSRPGNKGYGRFTLDGRRLMAHRVAYELLVGPVPEGMLLLHSCDNRACCNPAHMRPGTNAENMRDMVERGRSASGALNAKTKLSPDDVLYIVANPDRMSGKALAEKFGIAASTVSYIRQGRSWKYLVGRAGLEPATPAM